MNDEERRQWVLNDEGLYRWWRSERKPLHKFIRANRRELDACINKVLGGEQPPHYLAYPRTVR